MAMSRVILKFCITVCTMAAAFILVAAVPTPSTPAATPSLELESENTVLMFNQSQCFTNDESAVINEYSNSLCFGHYAMNKYFEDVPRGQCSNESVPITQIVRDMQYLLCGSSGFLELHVLASILQTYHSIAVQAASTATDLTMQGISDVLKGLVQNYFRVISPNHCSCTNASSCVTTVDLTERLNLASVTNGCSLAAYISKHIFNDHVSLFKNYSSIVDCRIPLIQDYSPSVCHQWVAEYIEVDSPAYSQANNICRILH